MAIAIDTSAQNIINNTAHTSNTKAYTVTGTNPIIVVYVSIDTTGDPTSVTYNSVGLTKIDSTTDGSRNLSAWQLVAPTTGSALNVVANFASSTNSTITIVSYTGTAQSSPVDNHAVNSSTLDHVTGTVTVNTANCWLLGVGDGIDSNTIFTLTSNKTDRQQAIGTLNHSFVRYHTSSDSNATVSTGSNSITWTISDTGVNMGGLCIIWSLLPFGAGSNTRHNLSLLGAGA